MMQSQVTNVTHLHLRLDDLNLNFNILNFLNGPNPCNNV